MTLLQRLQLRASEVRQKLNDLAGVEDLTDEQRQEVETLSAEYADLETRQRAAIIGADAEPERETRQEPDAETRELRQLQGQVQLANYVTAAMELRGLHGAEAEYNQHLNLREVGAFPLELLAPVETRATTDAESATQQQTWLDRLFADTAAMRLGITMPSVSPGVPSYPVTTAGGNPVQRGRSEAVGDAAWTVGVTELKPTRSAVRAVFNEEDRMRLPGLEDALRRDLASAMTEKIDRTIFLGDAGATDPGSNADAADITGLTTAQITEVTLKQADKVKGPETLAVFSGMVDGKHANGLEDLAVVASVGGYQLWTSTVANSAAENQTVGQFLRASGLMYTVRGEIDTATTSGKFGAFIGRTRNITGAGVAPVWNSGLLIRDPYSDAAKGEVAVTLSYFWNFGLPRASHFQRLKFVA